MNQQFRDKQSLPLLNSVKSKVIIWRQVKACLFHLHTLYMYSFNSDPW